MNFDLWEIERHWIRPDRRVDFDFPPLSARKRQRGGNFFLKKIGQHLFVNRLNSVGTALGDKLHV